MGLTIYGRQTKVIEVNSNQDFLILKGSKMRILMKTAAGFVFLFLVEETFLGWADFRNIPLADNNLLLICWIAFGCILILTGFFAFLLRQKELKDARQVLRSKDLSSSEKRIRYFDIISKFSSARISSTTF